jgi:hypothetical protein
MAAQAVTWCGTTGKEISIAGRTFRPDEDSAYVDFRLGHAFPVTTLYKSGIHPQVVANSYASLANKVFNLGHVMRQYDPKNNPRDLILGTVVAVEFPETPVGGWKVQGDRSQAPGIRAVAVMHKAAQWTNDVLQTWLSGTTSFSDTEWTVSMENEMPLGKSGFLVRGGQTAPADLAKFVDGTPADLWDLGYTYVPFMDAPDELVGCLNDDDDDAREGVASIRICRNYQRDAGPSCETLLLAGGLNGTIRFRGVGLCPHGMEPEARVAQMQCSQAGLGSHCRLPAAAHAQASQNENTSLTNAISAFSDFGKKILGS